MKSKIMIFISRTLKLIALVVPLACLINFAQDNLFYYEDHSTRRLELFYEEEKDSVDVMLMGASELTNGYSPGYAYENYGFTSYMYAMDFNRGTMYLSQLKEFLKYQDPQAIVVELFGFLVPSTWEADSEVRFRMYVESMPFSLNKAQTILESPFDNKISYFVPLVKYHGELALAQERLAKLNDVKKALPDLKGMNTTSSIYEGEGDSGDAFDPATFKLNQKTEKALIEFVEYCDDEGLDNVIFVNFPRVLVDENNNSNTAALEKVEEILNRYGHELIDLQKEKERIGLDVTHDFADTHHLNVYGQKKLTDYLGSRLVNEYKVKPKAQTAENQKKWEKCASDTRVDHQMMDALILRGEKYGIDELAHEKFNPTEIIGVG